MKVYSKSVWYQSSVFFTTTITKAYLLVKEIKVCTYNDLWPWLCLEVFFKSLSFKFLLPPKDLLQPYKQSGHYKSGRWMLITQHSRIVTIRLKKWMMTSQMFEMKSKIDLEQEEFDGRMKKYFSFLFDFKARRMHKTLKKTLDLTLKATHVIAPP